MTHFTQVLDIVQSYRSVLFRFLPFLWTAARGETVFMVTAVLLQGIVPALSVWITKQVVDKVAVALSQNQQLGFVAFSSLVAAWVGALLLETLLSPWVGAVQGNLGEKLSAHINLLLMRKADTFPDLSRFEDAKFYDELQLLQQQVSHQPLNLIVNLAEGGKTLFTVVAMFGLLVPLGFWIPFLIVATTIPQAYVSFQYELTIWDNMLEKSPQARRMQYCSTVMLTDTYAKEVRLFKLGSFFINRYVQAFGSFHQTMRHLRGKQAFWASNLAILSTLGNGFAFYWVVQQAFRGEISPGSVLLFVQSLAYLQQNLEQLVSTATLLFETLLYMQQFFSFLDSEPTMAAHYQSKPMFDSIRQGITFERVHFCYPDRPSALIDVSFTLYPGEIVALVGENGAGKTTLVKLLTRLYDPTKGAILVDGVDLKELDLDGWRRQIAAVFQDFGRYALTLLENIALGELEALDNLERIRRAVKKAGITTLVEKFPAREETLLGKQFGGTELSGGQWQKLALARAFVREDAQLLILDEPTAALDPRSEYEVFCRFVELARGKTTLLITHRLASVRMADRILVLQQGRLVEQGTHEELLRCGGEYAALWNMQVQQYGL
ncbi:ABC transporter ATP-binding protein [Microseira wollei]|uniref:ABC-type multidrug transport system, ATPase and permease component n=1 Tax=Microseira wollei NIES-4236 TaxID=2530354 RepID=A0AAV3XC60_9CYAN|nr:ATP-binding cassette domain-containing protein [Microseira wollei]GET39006.1 ABC-type multidrug transport system, ATPase and permease component [Microseira wollei NIES-4236]